MVVFERTSSFLSGLLAIALCFAAAAGKAGAQSAKEQTEAVPITVTAPTVFKTRPSTFVLPITVGDISGNGIFAYQFNIAYNAAVIDPTGPNFGCSTTGTLAETANLSATCNIQPDGVLRVAVSGTSAMTGSGTILKITFSTDPAAAGGSSSPLTFQNLFLFNSGGMVTSAASNGQVTILAPTAAGVGVGGTVLSADGRAVRKATLSLTDQSGVSRTTLSNAFGYYRFENVTAGETYVISVRTKTLVFAPRIFTVADELTDLNLIAEP
jgi:hypothetical protein